MIKRVTLLVEIKHNMNAHLLFIRDTLTSSYLFMNWINLMALGKVMQQSIPNFEVQKAFIAPRFFLLLAPLFILSHNLSPYLNTELL